MKLKLTPIVYTLRGYSDNIPNEELEGSPYKLVATVTVANNEAIISGLLGSVTKKDYKKLKCMLAELGYTALKYERRKVKHGL